MHDATASHSLSAQDRTREALSAIYPELRRIARRLLARERVNHTLQPTALVHEAVCRLLRREAAGLDERTLLLFGIREMKTLLIDSGRHNQVRRQALTVDRSAAGTEVFDLAELVHYETCLNRLAELDARAAQLLDLTFYAGLSVAEAAKVLQISERTATNDLSFAKSWLAVHWLNLSR